MNQNNENIIKILKELTLYELIQNCVGLKSSNISSEEVIYTAKQLQEIYPKLFSKYKLHQAIETKNLPYFKNGRDRYFIKSEIDKWIKNQNHMVK